MCIPWGFFSSEGQLHVLKYEHFKKELLILSDETMVFITDLCTAPP